MFGSIEQNKEYCSKEGLYVGFGPQYDSATNPHARKGRGTRNDLEEVREAIVQGMAMSRIADRYFDQFVKYSNGITKAQRLMMPDRPEGPREFIILWGEPGSGKSWKAKQIIGEDSYYEPDQNNSNKLSFENYDGQKWLLLEDYDPESMPVCVLKRITDRYTCILPGRGCSTRGLHSGVIITTNYNPALWYPKAPTDWDALFRRLSQCWHAKKAAWTNELTNEVIANPLPDFNAQIRADREQEAQIQIALL